ncbi:MAG: bifunctional glutamate N-acetyltransferase/amino-acid acetyltransferase ArgJ [Chloroflexota bacterium]|nr:bifunctional glutamate N-acetyltransferase/amino-acid acetyltransferase ArgJ [Chloroflexota bacterium]MDE2931893.1 bifunctional glutamate N-acetyltransferase/amino-acid acetyltransferase ArgJ [Chloroflexota bacterium]
MTEELAEGLVAGGATRPLGYLADGVFCGIKEIDPTGEKRDVGCLVSERPATVAGVYTKNVVKAAPVLLDQERMRRGTTRGIVYCSGNANACTGDQGMANAREMTALLAAQVGVDAEDILVCSTGVIGRQLPMDTVREGISQLKPAKERHRDAAIAMLTTDEWPKEGAALFEANGVSYAVGGMAKGAAMMHPNMATMLAYINTDAPVAGDFLHEVLQRAVDDSFHMISVDGDTSTNDTVLALANGAAGGPEITGGAAGDAFEAALRAVAVFLAKEIVRNAEGATKVFGVEVRGAATAEDARIVGRSVAASSLVKTAFLGSDPNWGRIMCAAGYSGVDFDPNKASLWLEDILLYRNGTPTDFDEDAASALLDRKQSMFILDLADGDATATAWGCDLTTEYVIFNSDYRT